MGTADELCLDVLINMITTFSKEYVGIKSLVIGGENPKWPVPLEKKPGTHPEPEMDPIAKLVRGSQRRSDATAEVESSRSSNDEFLRSMIGPESESILDDLIGDTIDLNDVDSI